MTRHYKNTSGSTISVPTVIEGDVEDQQVVDAPDDAVMAEEYFVEV